LEGEAESLELVAAAVVASWGGGGAKGGRGWLVSIGEGYVFSVPAIDNTFSFSWGGCVVVVVVGDEALLP